VAGFLARLAAGAEFRSLTSGLANPQGWLSDALGGPRSVSGQRVTVDKAFGLAPVYSAVSVISEAVGMLPFKVYRTLGDDEVAVASDHRAWRMLHDQPNPAMPAHRFWSTVTAQLLLWGNAFVRKERNPATALVDTLWLLDPARVMVEWNPATGEKRYTQQAGGNQPAVVYGDTEILHVTALSLNGVVGESVIGRCRDAFGNALARQKFEGGHWDRGALLRGVLETDKTLGVGTQAEEAVKRIRTGFATVYSGVDQSSQTALLEDGMTFKPLSMPLADMQFVEIAELSRSEIAMLFKLPASYLNASTGDSLTYATVEGNQVQFATNAIAPVTNTIQKAISADTSIFPFSSWYAEFVLEGLMRGAHSDRADFYKTMSDIRALTVNEIRARENLKPVPWGDEPPVPPHLPTAQAIAEAGDAPKNGNGNLTPQQVAALAAGAVQG
jgi:HK97 family phage portal protein